MQHATRAHFGKSTGQSQQFRASIRMRHTRPVKDRPTLPCPAFRVTTRSTMFLCNFAVPLRERETGRLTAAAPTESSSSHHASAHAAAHAASESSAHVAATAGDLHSEPAAVHVVPIPDKEGMPRIRVKARGGWGGGELLALTAGATRLSRTDIAVVVAMRIHTTPFLLRCLEHHAHAPSARYLGTVESAYKLVQRRVSTTCVRRYGHVSGGGMENTPLL